jgi:hypothetical protein
MLCRKPVGISHPKTSEHVLHDPKAIPTPAAPKPRCQSISWPRYPQTSGAMKAPRLMPM